MVTEHQPDSNAFRVITLPNVISLPTLLPSEITQATVANENRESSENSESNENYVVAWNKDIDIASAENLPVKFIVSDDDNGYVEYGAIVSGQRQGLKARITPAMLNTGSAAAYEFPFLSHHYDNRLDHVNLLARFLGGNGKEPRNIIPLPFNNASLPKLQLIEKEIVVHVASGNTAELFIRVSYSTKGRGSSFSLFPQAVRYVIKKIKGISSKIQQEKVFEMPIYWPA